MSSTKMDIVLVGLNHKTAPVALRECIAFSGDEMTVALDALRTLPSVRESILLSTCNRVEIIMAGGNSADAAETAKMFVSEFKNIPVSQFEKSLYFHEGSDAVRHVFRVAASLDSMMVGEPQILGQLKDAYRVAIENKNTGVILNRLLHKTFSVAKRVRTETGIGDHAVSISYAAIELGKKIFGDLQGKKVLMIGAGEMAELAVEHLIRNKATDIHVANRTFERGVELAKQFNGKAVRFDEIRDCLIHVDIIISSTGSPDYVIRRKQVKEIMPGRKNRPLFFIDIAVPRDIDPEINRIGNAYVYDIDDLKGVVDDNIEDRNREAIKGERIVDEAVIAFGKWYEGLGAAPTIVALRKKIDRIAQAEINRTLRARPNFSEDDRKAVCKMTQAMINKILHDPTLFLKSNGYHGDKSAFVDITRKLFNLDE